MDANGGTSGWLLFLVQLPKSPSSTRVALWRRLRAAGATTMVHSAWVLPRTAPHEEFLGQLRDKVLRHGGTAFVLSVSVPSPEASVTIVAHFRADRGREYDEFAERCTALLDEIGKETKAGKHTFAEMEESEQDLEKLGRWLAKIEARDFFPDERREQSAAMLARCRSAVEAFSQAVYAAEGVTGADNRGHHQAPGGAHAG
jgi:Protein ChrB, N-terminal